MTRATRPIPDLPRAELDVLKVLWTLHRGTVAEVRAGLARAGVDQAYTTVMTLLGRLVARHAAAVVRDHAPFVYRPAVSRDAVVRVRVARLADELFDGDVAALAAALRRPARRPPRPARAARPGRRSRPPRRR